MGAEQVFDARDIGTDKLIEVAKRHFAQLIDDPLPAYDRSTQALRRELIETALWLCNGNTRRTAAMLHVNRSTLIMMIQRMGITGARTIRGSSAR